MADSNIVTQEEMTLRRRARRRLVGAVAIALAAVVALPMLFDPEPKPLGPEVDLRIPAKDTPFEPAPGVPAASASNDPEPAPHMAEPTQPVSPPLAQTAQPIETQPATESKPEKPALKEAVKPATNEIPIDSKASEAIKTPAKAEPKPEIKSTKKPDAAFASKGFYLQLGAFSSEMNARQLQEKVQSAGFKVGMTGTNGQFRVRVGPIVEHDKAMEMQARLKAKGFSPVLLGP
jgi:DedD protein